MSAAAIVELVVMLAPFIGIPILCKRDPSGLYAAELARRRADRDRAHDASA